MGACGRGVGEWVTVRGGRVTVGEGWVGARGRGVGGYLSEGGGVHV